MARSCNPSYSGSRDQKDCSLKPAQTNSSQDLISKKNPSQKWADGVAQGVGLEFSAMWPKKQSVNQLSQTLIQVKSCITFGHMCVSMCSHTPCSAQPFPAISTTFREAWEDLPYLCAVDSNGYMWVSMPPDVYSPWLSCSVWGRLSMSGRPTPAILKRS
jgi:hypothetical protein